MISNKDVRVEDSNIVINGEKHPLDPAVIALSQRANIVQGKLSALDTKITAIEALEKTASGNPISLTGVAAAYAMSNIMTIEPIQDLHGYDKPWQGGGGKNLLPMTVDGLKAANTNGTWSGNVYTFNDVNFSIQTDSDGNVIGILADGTATGGHALFNLGGVSLLSSITYKYNGNPTNLDYNKRIDIYNSDNSYFKSIVTDGDFIVEPIHDESYYLRIAILNGYTASNLLFKPMLRLSTETDNTFAPYTNICPISGLTSGEVSTTDGTDTNTATITFGQTVYGGSVNFRTGEVTVTHGFITFDGSEPWYTNGDRGVYLSCVDISANMKANGDIVFSDYAVIDSGDAPVSNGYANFNVSGSAIQIHDENGMTSAAYKTYLSTHNVQLCYELATPTTLTLTPAELELLKGANTISGNGVTINISYIGR